MCTGNLQDHESQKTPDENMFIVVFSIVSGDDQALLGVRKSVESILTYCPPDP